MQLAPPVLPDAPEDVESDENPDVVEALTRSLDPRSQLTDAHQRALRRAGDGPNEISKIGDISAYAGLSEADLRNGKYDDLCDAWKAAGANAGKRLSSKKACDLQEQAIEWARSIIFERARAANG
jgi:hypothetical protein